MFEKAYGHYNRHLKTICFSGWMQFHLRKRYKRDKQERAMELAVLHHRHRIYRLVLQSWTQWTRFRKGRQAIAFNKIQHVYHVAVGRVIFKAWHNVTLDAKRTREYFERLERGENMEDDDIFGRGSGEARDDISMLPTRVAIKMKYFRVTDKVAARLLSKCRPYLVHLNLRRCERITSLTFYSIRECRNLQDLNLSECPALDDDSLKMVLEGCKIIIYLNISHSLITDASLRSISKYCLNLQYLSLAFCLRYSDKGLQYLANGESAKRLNHLDISGCSQVTPNGLAKLSEGCSDVQTLLLNDIESFDDACLEAITDNCKNLRNISFLGSHNLSDNALKNVATSKKLQMLKIDSNCKITDITFKYIGKSCHELRHLYLVDCHRITDLTLKVLSQCRNLTVVNLADCVRITDTGVRYLVESSCGNKLQELNLTNCIRVGDIALVNIHKRCHNLTYLHLCFCEHISEAGIELLGQTHSLTALDISGCNCGDAGLSSLGNNIRLKDVNLSECSAITDLGLQKFAQQCTEIERLDLSHCQMITDGAIKNLAFCCRMLTHLSLAGCKLLTDLSVQYLSGVCHYLLYLDISGSLHITDKSMKYLKKGCKKLQTLIMLYCSHISKHAVHKMQKCSIEVRYSADEVPLYYNY
ncbi:hypothetical protein CAPTEDRAFT_165456 [Capitella teleta]|uniref:F-box/LRR-repeat protein 15-like leucin rich repeat domain-containing protein n=1 Tax=Capitella teleta TaxID=283909 RepID=R7TAX0_CAPTE|nr:hypothetical protein CAPTEDRAFT_165456 [Capitella teleta]|eukprot:ELT90873.1 hypothetical protein CAPTEDRAFT_165456 [Capitella teleta]